MAETSANGQPLSKKKRRMLEQYTPEQMEVYKLGTFLTNCCKTMDLKGAMDKYLEAKQKGIMPPKEAFNNLLALAAGLGEQGSGSFPIRTEEPPSDITSAFIVFNDAKAAGAVIQEAAYSGLIRCCSLNDRHVEGLAILREMQAAGITPRLRSYSALVAAYCAIQDEAQSVLLFEELTETYHLQPLERDYVAMLGLFCAVDNAVRFYATLHSLMEDILVPTKDVWKVLTSWFTTGNRVDRYVVGTYLTSPVGHIEGIDYTLRPVELSPENKALLLDQIESSICGENGPAPRKRKHKVITPAGQAQSTDGGKVSGGSEESGSVAVPTESSLDQRPKKKDKGREAREKWTAFKKWISEHADPSPAQGDAEGNPIERNEGGETKIDVLIDGANVGYYQQNFENASGYIDYFQLDSMVRHLMDTGRRPLLILHCRHVFNDIPDMYKDVVKSWRKKNILYVTPAGCNDDTFWLYLTVHLGCDVVTNDEMRDHHFQMLSPR